MLGQRTPSFGAAPTISERRCCSQPHDGAPLYVFSSQSTSALKISNSNGFPRSLLFVCTIVLADIPRDRRVIKPPNDVSSESKDFRGVVCITPTIILVCAWHGVRVVVRLSRHAKVNTHSSSRTGEHVPRAFGAV